MALQLREQYRKALPVISVISGTIIALACGTNYAFSAWGPQYSKRMGLSSTESNLIGTSGNFGMYLFGIPCGMLVDAKGPRVGAVLGAALIGIGYYGLFQAYVNGRDSAHLVLLCFSCGLTGIGSASGFFGTIKTATINWPTHRGTATAFPIAAFGLSAFLFSLIGGLAFHEDTAGLLLTFTLGASLMVLVPAYFLQLVSPADGYSEVPTEPDTAPERRTESPFSRQSGLLRSHSSGRLRLSRSPLGKTELHEDSTYPDVKGIRMLKYSAFYELFLLLGSMTGIGLMTINNIGNDAQALWSAWGNEVESNELSIEGHQKAYVSIISVCSCVGRLLGGIGSDYLAMRRHRSRFWCVFASSLLFCLAQLLAILATNPHLLAVLSGLNGLAYGILFGVMPVLVAETFGSAGISQNWGFMTLSAIIFGNIFNIAYGRIYDQHSHKDEQGNLVCYEGRLCYKDAYWLTFGVAVAAMVLSLWCVHRRQIIQERQAKRRESDEHLE